MLPYVYVYVNRSVKDAPGASGLPYESFFSHIEVCPKCNPDFLDIKISRKYGKGELTDSEQH